MKTKKCLVNKFLPKFIYADNVVVMVAFECPFCNQALEVQPPDKLHSAYSFDKPAYKSYHGKVIEKKLLCQNPNCNEQFIVYWYAPYDYFNRVWLTLKLGYKTI